MCHLTASLLLLSNFTWHYKLTTVLERYIEFELSSGYAMFKKPFNQSLSNSFLFFFFAVTIIVLFLVFFALPFFYLSSSFIVFIVD